MLQEMGHRSRDVIADKVRKPCRGMIENILQRSNLAMTDRNSCSQAMFRCPFHDPFEYGVAPRRFKA